MIKKNPWLLDGHCSPVLIWSGWSVLPSFRWHLFSGTALQLKTVTWHWQTSQPSWARITGRPYGCPLDCLLSVQSSVWSWHILLPWSFAEEAALPAALLYLSSSFLCGWTSCCALWHGRHYLKEMVWSTVSWHGFTCQSRTWSTPRQPLSLEWYTTSFHSWYCLSTMYLQKLTTTPSMPQRT